MPEADAEKYLTQREAELLIEASANAQISRSEAHRREHGQQQEAIDKAMGSEVRAQGQHNDAHDKAHDSHEEKHKAETEAVKTALAAVDRERNIHAIAHDKEHIGHQSIHAEEQKAVHTALAAVGRERDIHAAAHEKAHGAHDKEHELNKLAIEKAEKASDDRFHSVNEFRAQLAEIISHLASKETVESLIKENERRWEEVRKDMDRRFIDAGKLTQEHFEANRLAITNIEKGDVKQEGRGLGQTATVGIIVGTISLIGTILGILIVASNLLTNA